MFWILWLPIAQWNYPPFKFDVVDYLDMNIYYGGWSVGLVSTDLLGQRSVLMGIHPCPQVIEEALLEKGG
jgi:hypothetical protein